MLSDIREVKKMNCINCKKILEQLVLISENIGMQIDGDTHLTENEFLHQQWYWINSLITIYTMEEEE